MRLGCGSEESSKVRARQGCTVRGRAERGWAREATEALQEPSQKLTLIGSLRPTSHSFAIEVIAKSSQNSSAASGFVGSVASSYLATPLFTCSCTHGDMRPLTASIASRGVAPSSATCHATRVKNSPPTSASSARWVNITARAAAAAASSSRKAAIAAALRMLMAFEMPPSRVRSLSPSWSCCRVPML